VGGRHQPPPLLVWFVVVLHPPGTRSAPCRRLVIHLCRNCPEECISTALAAPVHEKGLPEKMAGNLYQCENNARRRCGSGTVGRCKLHGPIFTRRRPTVSAHPCHTRLTGGIPGASEGRRNNGKRTINYVQAAARVETQSSLFPMPAGFASPQRNDTAYRGPRAQRNDLAARPASA
jgi:hypothetical protein